MINSIRAPEVNEVIVQIQTKMLVDSLDRAIDNIIAKYNTLVLLKKNNPGNVYVNTKLRDTQNFGINITTIALLHDPHTFFSGRSLETIKTLLIEDANSLNILMTLNHLYYSDLAINGISIKDVLFWFSSYYSSMQMTNEEFNLLSKESVNAINEPKAGLLVTCNIWLLPLFMLILNPQIVDKLTFVIS